MAEQTGKLIDERNEEKKFMRTISFEKMNRKFKICVAMTSEYILLETDILTFLFSDVLTR